MSSVPNVKWTAYANICLLICLYFILTIELRRSHHKVSNNALVTACFLTRCTLTSVCLSLFPSFSPSNCLGLTTRCPITHFTNSFSLYLIVVKLLKYCTFAPFYLKLFEHKIMKWPFGQFMSIDISAVCFFVNFAFAYLYVKIRSF